MDHSIHLPSAGLNRFRFDGSAFASQPLKAPRGNTKHRALRSICKPKSLEQPLPRRYAANKGVHHEPEYLRSFVPRHHLG